ncbi:sulfatase-like hydrolase/transferase [Saccharicrinis sp. 156]|uniref:sulfatase-like hydrolase/transferase n=1 Tax=Saccharicrinis sp. 156 TaxID=3417574 RepID=UPI003D33FCF0
MNYFKQLLLIALCIVSFSKGYTQEKPNIIFLLTDDQRWDCFGFNNPDVKTPNCDKMAQEGIVFSNTHHAVPICQPSRASIQLGRYVGAHLCSFSKPSDYTISEDEYKNSYPALLREAGYFTGFVGKFGFPVSKNKEKNVDYVDGKRITDSQKWKIDEYMPAAYFDVWNGFSGQGNYNMYGDEGHLTKVNGDRAIDFIQTAKKQDRPFCLSVSFKAPHSPFNDVDARFKKWYDDIEISRMENDSQKFHNLLPDVVKKEYRGRNGYKNDENYQKFIKAYYGLISGVDDVVGRIREELKRQGLDENTIIIYTADNGYFCGSKGLSGKDLLYEESMRAPLIVFNPALENESRGKTIDELVSVVDFAPTILDLCDVKVPAIIQGKSFKSMIYGGEKPFRDFVFAENNFDMYKPSSVNGELDEEGTKGLKAKGTVRSKVIRTKEYKYIRYFETEPMVEELWNIEADPMETNNLVDNPDYSKVLSKMRKLCDTRVARNKKQASMYVKR